MTAGRRRAPSYSTLRVSLAASIAKSISRRLGDQLLARPMLGCSLVVRTARLFCAWCQLARLILPVPRFWNSTLHPHLRVLADRVPYPAMKVFARTHRVAPRLRKDLS